MYERVERKPWKMKRRNVEDVERNKVWAKGVLNVAVTLRWGTEANDYWREMLEKEPGLDVTVRFLWCCVWELGSWC